MIRIDTGWCLLAMLMLGGLLTLAFAPYDYSFFAFVALAGWHWCAAKDAATPVYKGLAFGLGMFGIGLWWVYISIHDFGGAHPLAAVALTALLIAFCALFPILTMLLLARLPDWLGVWGRIFAAAMVWMAVEYFRGYLLLNGFPWLQIAYSQIDLPLAGYAPIVGAYGVGFLLAISAFAVAESLSKRLPMIQAAAMLLLIWGGGAALRSVSWTQPIGEPFTVTLIQGNIGQGQKWLPEQKLNTLRLYRQLTQQHWDSKVIVWPETAIPAFLSAVKQAYLDPLAAEANQHGVDLVVSLPSGGDKLYYNSMLVLSDSAKLYHKNHLLPFGEYLPLQPLSGWILDQMQIPLGDFTPGGDRQPLLTAGGYPFISSICYEDVFGEEQVRQLHQAAYLVNVTNDAWFGDSDQPHQHMQMARMRALESGRYLVRATNTGLSGFVDPSGRLFSKAPMFTTTTLTERIVPMAGMTPYAYLGDRWVLLILAVSTLAVVFAERYRNKPR